MSVVENTVMHGLPMKSFALALLALTTVALAATPDAPPPPDKPTVPAAPATPTVPAAPARPTVPAAPATPSVPAAPAAPALPKAPARPDDFAPSAKSAKPSAERPADSLTLTGPSVVIFHASRADIARAEPQTDAEKEETLAFRKDFEGGATKLQQALKAHPQIKVIVSSADVVRFADPKQPPVWRYSLGAGYGYVFYQPGKPLRVFSGVRSGDGLICEASRMFDTKPKPPHCDP